MEVYFNFEVIIFCLIKLNCNRNNFICITTVRQPVQLIHYCHGETFYRIPISARKQRGL